jgi:putative peptidoglycan lipid II flippase
MRRKMLEGHPNRSALFDVKHDPGGMVDIEFLVQYLVLAHSATHPELLDNAGNIALLARAAAAGDLARFRSAIGDGTRLIVYLLLPASVVIAVLATPIIALLFQRGAWTPEQTPGVAQALVAFALGLALNGVILLLTRSFFALQHVWAATGIALANLVISASLSLLFYRPFGVWGIPLANSIANAIVVPLMWIFLSRRIGHLPVRHVIDGAARALAASVVAGAIAYGIWRTLNDAFGTSLPAQIVSVGIAVGAAGGAYLLGTHLLRFPEAARIMSLMRKRRQGPE